jgi:hypothetical protein
VKYYMACYRCNEKILVAKDDGGWTFYVSLPECTIELGDWLREQAYRECAPAFREETNVHGLNERIWQRPVPQHCEQQK